MKRSKRRILGQHFLTNPEILDRIVEYGQLSESDIVLEVGAGRGELTKRIAEKAGKVIAVELDRELAEELERNLSTYSNVEILIGDVLKLRPTGFNKVVSNPPYSISRKLLEWLMESRPKLMVLTLQREFAAKLVAKPGSSKYLYISFLSNLLYEAEIKEIIPRSFFNPPPKVDSAIVLMNRKESAEKLEDDVKEIIKALFTCRRQTLRHALRDLLKSGKEGESIFSKIPEEALSKRVFQLTPKELIEIAEIVAARKAKPK